VIQKHLVYRKSSKGSEAIATRQHGLSPKLRPILILVDGKRTVEEMSRIAQGLGDNGQSLEQLLGDGFIEPVASSVHSAIKPAASTPAVPAPSLSLPDARRYAVRRLTDILGPHAEDFCLRIEAARSSADFNAAVTRAEGMVRQFKGAHAANEFVADMLAHQPSRTG
jgi:hypothetical protein